MVIYVVVVDRRLLEEEEEVCRGHHGAGAAGGSYRGEEEEEPGGESLHPDRPTTLGAPRAEAAEAGVQGDGAEPRTGRPPAAAAEGGRSMMSTRREVGRGREASEEHHQVRTVTFTSPDYVYVCESDWNFDNYCSIWVNLFVFVGHERSRSRSRGREHTISPAGGSDEGEIRDDGMSPISDGGLEDTQVSVIGGFYWGLRYVLCGSKKTENFGRKSRAALWGRSRSIP